MTPAPGYPPGASDEPCDVCCGTTIDPRTGSVCGYCHVPADVELLALEQAIDRAWRGIDGGCC